MITSSQLVASWHRSLNSSWEKAGKIWYITLRDRLRPWSNFSWAAKQTISVAGELYGQNSAEQQAVSAAWKQVGVEPGGLF